MDQSALRTLTSQLADDLSWLENHARQSGRPALEAAQLRLAASLVRNVLGPWLDNQAVKPLHVAVVGGAGAGKSTTVNFLCGGVVAESNPQAGFTRHPVAYMLPDAPTNWADHLNFLGPLKRLSRPGPSNIDEDVYQVRRVGSESKDPSLLQTFVVWDCPDMTTYAAGGYVQRLVEVGGLADVLIYVASDERYNDEVPTRFLHMFVQTEKPVIVSLVKARPSDVEALLDHFKKEVLAHLPMPPAVVLAIPQLTAQQLHDPVTLAADHREKLLAELRRRASSADATRKKTVRTAVHYLKQHQDELLSVAREDLAALEGWQQAVRQGQMEFEQRYRHEYLTGERFRRFDEALVRLLELLEMPGVGKLVSRTLYVLRTPYRWIKGLFNKAMQRPQASALPERPVLEAAFTGWIDHLRKEASRRDKEHALWAHLARGFAAGLPQLAKEHFEQHLRDFHLSLANEVDITARRIYEDLEKNPSALNTLRGTKFAMEIAAIAASIAVFGTGLIDIVLVPLAASVTQHLVELLGKAYVESQRGAARARQQALVSQQVSGPLAEWLINWPATGGTQYERLQMALKRIGPALNQLAEAIKV